MAVMGTWPLRAPAVELTQLRGQPPADHQQLEAGLGGQLDDQGMGIDGEQPGLEVPERLDEDHRVLAAADGHQEPAGSVGPPSVAG